MATEIILDLSSKGGLAPNFHSYPEYEDPQPHLNAFGDDDQFADGIINPFRRPGFLGPANNTASAITVSATSSHATMFSASEVDSVNGDLYFLGGGTTDPNIWTISDYTNSTYSIANTISTTAGSIVGTDLQIYSINGLRAMYYSYQQAGGGDIGIYNFSTYQNNAFSSAAGFRLTSGGNHKMVVSDNGFMYILDGQDLHKFDGTIDGGGQGSAEADVLTFPEPYQLTDGVDGRGYLWLAISGTTQSIEGTTISQTTHSQYCGVYIWDRKTRKASAADFIPVPGAKEIRQIFFFEDNPWLFTVSFDQKVELRKFTGSNFRVEFELDRGAIPSRKDSVVVRPNGVYWLGRNSLNLYVMGRVTPKSKLGIFKVGRTSTWAPSVTTGGILAFAGGNPGVTSGDFLTPDTAWVEVSAGSTNNYLRRWFPHSRTIDNVTLEPHAGDYRSLVKALPKLSILKGITLFYPPTGSGSTNALDVDVYFNRASTSASADTLTLNDGVRGWHYIPFAERNVNYVQLGLRYRTGVAVGSQITPEYALIHYDRAQKRS